MVVSLHLHLHHRISIGTPSDSSFHDVLLSMRFGLTRHFPLKRSFASITTESNSPVITMATTESKNLVKTSTEEKDNKKEETEDKKEEEVLLPPPPEKPDPGDCCGSGCVRCVWDVYYEQLEEYNNKISGETKSI
ncbi:hypothetical protein V5N11_030724 [Cardamine amara subsp. amara]|uniref:Oxidoreductase-like domain-containing protein n=1 Tax=Cardamine amara subsp. amara TaxID=228776 RepID=A0ABD1A2D1_CARAN